MNASATPAANAVETTSASGEPILRFENAYWSLDIGLGPTINPNRLVNRTSGMVVADTDYCYQVVLAPSDRSGGFAGGQQILKGITLVDWTIAEGPAPGSTTLTVHGRLDFGRVGPTDLRIAHSFTLYEAADRIDEQITLNHRFGHDAHTLELFRLGFRKRLYDTTTTSWVDGLDKFELVPVPFRRRRGQAVDYLKDSYSAADIVPANWSGNNLPGRASEAWSWHGGGRGIVIAKYTQEHIEFALADGEFYTTGQAPDSLTGGAKAGSAVFRFGGAGYTHGAPGVAVRLDNETRQFRFGTTSIVPFEGGWEDGHRTYAQLMREKGHVTPKGFNPPVHWNELYELSWRGGNNAPLQELPELYAQAEIAQTFGAEAFYFDPVWDLFEGSSVWDEARLGPLADFVRTMKDKYGLETSLHLMMHTKSLSEDPRIYRRDENGEIVRWKGIYEGGYICANDVWKAMKTERLLKLAEAGVTFFMFDFTEYHMPQIKNLIGHHSQTPCSCPDHGHSVPMSLEEHSRGIIEVMQNVKKAYPDLLIEAHDRITGGLQDYLPLYYEHNLDGTVTYDEHWGFEYMWEPYMDLLSGKALSLYEYNLAYDIPLYLHINLHFDNVTALAFWWYASTCRHLGLGGVKPGHKNWESHCAAMREYRRLKPFFAEGRFVGLDRLLHGHVIDDRKSAVLAAFNTTSDTVELASPIDLNLMGIPDDATLSGDGISLEDGTWMLRHKLAPLSPAIIEVRWS